MLSMGIPLNVAASTLLIVFIVELEATSSSTSERVPTERKDYCILGGSWCTMADSEVPPSDTPTATEIEEQVTTPLAPENVMSNSESTPSKAAEEESTHLEKTSSEEAMDTDDDKQVDQTTTDGVATDQQEEEDMEIQDQSGMNNGTIDEDSIVDSQGQDGVGERSQETDQAGGTSGQDRREDGSGAALCSPGGGIGNQGMGDGVNNQGAGDGVNNQGEGSIGNQGDGVNNQGEGSIGNQGDGVNNQGVGDGVNHQGEGSIGNQGDGMNNQGDGMNNQGDGVNNQGGVDNRGDGVNNQGDGSQGEGGAGNEENQNENIDNEEDSFDIIQEEEIAEFVHPENSSLEGFGYHFNQDGELRSIDKDEPFRFEVKKNNRWYNQKHYEALGDVITEEVYTLLETRGRLTRHLLPVDPKDNEPQSFFFMSEDALENPDKLLILIHGSGAVRAGQWARSLIINHSIHSGTQLPYIERGIKEGYGVMVLNTNQNYAEVDGRSQPIRGNSSPGEHAKYVWNQFVKESKAKRIDIVAHSYGGVVTVDLVSDYFDDFKSRVHKIAFTDSVHTLNTHRVTRKMKRWMMKHVRNWVSSTDDLDTPQPSYFEDDIHQVSAGTPKHVETSWKAFESVFKFFVQEENTHST